MYLSITSMFLSHLDFSPDEREGKLKSILNWKRPPTYLPSYIISAIYLHQFFKQSILENCFFLFTKWFNDASIVSKEPISVDCFRKIHKDGWCMYTSLYKGESLTCQISSPFNKRWAVFKIKKIALQKQPIFLLNGEDLKSSMVWNFSNFTWQIATSLKESLDNS